MSEEPGGCMKAADFFQHFKYSPCQIIVRLTHLHSPWIKIRSEPQFRQCSHHYTFQMSQSEFWRNYYVSLIFSLSAIKSWRQVEFDVRNYNLKTKQTNQSTTRCLPSSNAQRSWLRSDDGRTCCSNTETVHEKRQTLSEHRLPEPQEPIYVHPFLSFL